MFHANGDLLIGARHLRSPLSQRENCVGQNKFDRLECAQLDVGGRQHRKTCVEMSHLGGGRALLVTELQSESMIINIVKEGLNNVTNLQCKCVDGISNGKYW